MFLDKKYARLIGYKLDRFKDKGHSFNFRCPFCGDSKKSQSKARGWLYPAKGQYFYKCHNCGVTHNLQGLLKSLDFNLYQQYVLEKFKGGRASTVEAHIAAIIPAKRSPKILDGLSYLKDLPEEHCARIYAQNRNWPDKAYDIFLYCDEFQYNDKGWHDSRILIPFIDQNNELMGVCGRAIDPRTKMRYTNIMIDGRAIFGLDRIKYNKPVYIFEGAIDSIFVDNAISISGLDNNISNNGLPAEAEYIYVLDNQPQHPDVIRAMNKVLVRGYKIVLWPQRMNGKDLNDMINNGHTQEEIEDVMCNHVVSGPSGILEFNAWKRIAI